MTDRTAADTTELDTALAASSGGDTVTLTTDGSYGSWTPATPQTYGSEVVIRADTGVTATFTKISIDGWTFLTVDGASIVTGGTVEILDGGNTTGVGFCVEMFKCIDTHIKRCLIKSTPAGTPSPNKPISGVRIGYNAGECVRCSVASCIIQDVQTGITIDDCTDCIIEDNEILDREGDGFFQQSGQIRLIVRRNFNNGSFPPLGAHADFYQSGSGSSVGRGSLDCEIYENHFWSLNTTTETAGQTDNNCIFFENPASGRHVGWLIHDNIIHLNAAEGIAIGNCDKCVIDHNTLVHFRRNQEFANDQARPGITLSGEGTGADANVVQENIVARPITSVLDEGTGNTVINNLFPATPDYFDRWLVDPIGAELVRDITKYDVLPGKTQTRGAQIPSMAPTNYIDFTAYHRQHAALQGDFAVRNYATQALQSVGTWDFGNGKTSTEDQPTHVYAEAGEYTITADGLTRSIRLDHYNIFRLDFADDVLSSFNPVPSAGIVGKPPDQAVWEFTGTEAYEDVEGGPNRAATFVPGSASYPRVAFGSFADTWISGFQMLRMQVRFKYDSSAGGVIIDGGAQCPSLTVLGTGALRASLELQGQSRLNYDGSVPTANPFDGAYHTAIMTWNGLTGDITLSLDAETVLDTTEATAVGVYRTTTNFVINIQGVSGPNGAVDWVQIDTTAGLTPPETSAGGGGTISIIELNGPAPGTPTDKTSDSVRFKNADDATLDTSAPLIVPTSGQEYSYQKYLRLRDNGQAYTQIDNLRAYSDGQGFQGQSPETEKIWYATSAGYVAPAVPNEAFDPPEYPSTGSPTSAMQDLFSTTAASPIDLDFHFPGPYTQGSPSEYIGDFLVLVMEVEVGATRGLLAAETLTFAWDQI